MVGVHDRPRAAHAHRLAGVGVVALERAVGGPGWLAVFPCAAGYPGTSTVNDRVGVPVADAALVDATSGVCARASQPVDLILDVFGESG